MTAGREEEKGLQVIDRVQEAALAQSINNSFPSQVEPPPPPTGLISAPPSLT